MNHASRAMLRRRRSTSGPHVRSRASQSGHEGHAVADRCGKLDLRWVDRDQSARDFCADHGRTCRRSDEDIHRRARGCAPVERGRDSPPQAHQGSERGRHRWADATGFSGCRLPTHRHVRSRAGRASDSAREAITCGPPIFDGDRRGDHRVNRDRHCGSPVASGPVDCVRPCFLRRSERSPCHDRNRSWSTA